MMNKISNRDIGALQYWFDKYFNSDPVIAQVYLTLAFMSYSYLQRFGKALPLGEPDEMRVLCDIFLQDMKQQSEVLRKWKLYLQKYGAVTPPIMEHFRLYITNADRPADAAEVIPFPKAH